MEIPSQKSTIEEIRERFDNDVERFSNLETGQQTTIDAPLSLELITEAARYVSPGATSVLDIGCGAGNYTLKMLSKIAGLNCTLIDLSFPMLTRAKERVSAATPGNVNTMQGDIRSLEVGKEQFDIVLAGAVLHHLRTDEEWEQVFKKIYDSLKPGGSFWISDLIVQENSIINSLFQDRYADYLTGIGGQEFQQKVFAYVEKEDTPRSLNFQLKTLENAGFSYTEVLHKNACFAAFGGIK